MAWLDEPILPTSQWCTRRKCIFMRVWKSLYVTNLGKSHVHDTRRGVLAESLGVKTMSGFSSGSGPGSLIHT